MIASRSILSTEATERVNGLAPGLYEEEAKKIARLPHEATAVSSAVTGAGTLVFGLAGAVPDRSL
jgi:hypothetical protein